MRLFSKDEKEKTVETKDVKKGETPNIEEVMKVDIDKEYPYIIQLNDVAETTTVRKKPFGAKRYIDGANVWLVNEKVGFKEPLPESSDEYKQYKIEEIDNKIDEIYTRLDNINKDKKKKNLSSSIKTPDELDLLQDMKVLRGFKRSLELAGRGSYMVISEEHGGRQLYTFDRKGNFKLPVFKNTDYSLLYVPNEADISIASDLLKLNEEKNGDKNDQIKLANVILTVLLVITVCFVLYLAWKTSSMPTDVIDGINAITTNMGDITNNFNSLLDKLNSSITVTEPRIEPTFEPKTINISD